MLPRADLIVLHVAPLADGLVGGPAFSVTSLLNALHQRRISVALLSTGPQGSYTKPQPYPVFAYRDLKRGSLSSLPPPFNRPDLIHFHSTYIPSHAWLALQARKLEIPYIIAPRGGMNKGAQARKRWKKRLGNLLFFSHMVRHATAIHCLTGIEAEETRRWGRPVFVVGNGVDLPAKDRLARPGQGAKLSFLFLGRLDIAHKGLDLLLEGWSIAKESLIRAQAELMIYGPDVNRSNIELRRLIESLGLTQIVQLNSLVLGEEKARTYASADVFVHTSRHEGHPMAVLEALAYGLPCLLTPGTNMAHDVQAAGAGWQVDGTPHSIAQGLIDVSQSVNILSEKGRAARAMAEERYQWNSVGAQLIDQYTHWIKGIGEQ